MKKYTPLAVILLVCTFASSGTNPEDTVFTIKRESDANPVGTLPGSFGVSPSGAATYTIPLDLPPGRAGMTPEISLNYNSQGGDGVMGKGWSIGGWSFIGRVNETQYYDQRNGSVDFADDVFSLDGKRLIEIPSSKSEVIYRTEIDEVSKIVLLNAQKDNAYFVIHTKAGLKKYYGDTPDSKQVYGLSTNPAIRYHLNKVEDKLGNFIHYEYEQTDGTGELYLKQIVYTKHANITNASTYTINFIYSLIDNNYTRTSFFANGENSYQYQVAKKLNEIKVIYNDKINDVDVTITKYLLSYELAGMFSDKPYLKSIQLEGENQAKLNATTFEWDYNQAIEGVPEEVITGVVVQEFNQMDFIYGTGDFNGDGISDIVESGSYDSETDGTFIRLGGQLGTNPIWINDIVYYQTSAFICSDVNGDGMDELFLNTSSSICGYKFDISGQSLTPIQIGSTNKSFLAMGDFNGDGLIDFILKQDTNPFFYLHQGLNDLTQFFSSSIQIENFTLYSTDKFFRTGDFTGDGITDFACFHRVSQYPPTYSFDIHTLQFDGGAQTPHYDLIDLEFLPLGLVLSSVTFASFDIGDFNADGKDDMILTLEYPDPDGRVTHICYSYGKGWVNKCVDIGDYFNDDLPGEHKILDLNNDGLSDICSFEYESIANTSINIHFRKFIKCPGINSGFIYDAENTQHSASNYNMDNILMDGWAMGDFSGNGEPDLFYAFVYEEEVDLRDNTGDRVLVNSQRRAHTLSDETLGDDLIVSVVNGLGAQQSVEYERFDPTGYTPTSYPVLPYKGPFYIVQKIKTANPDGGYFPDVEYEYKGMQVHAQGKGLLGFQQLTIINNLNGTKTVTDFELYIDNDKYFYPYPETIEVKALSNDQLLTKTTNVIGKKNLILEEDYDKIFIPVITESFTIVKDLNGAGIRSTKTRQLVDYIDDYGNSTKSQVMHSEWVWSINQPDGDYNWQKTIENEYEDEIDLQNWLVGRPTYTKVTDFHDEGGSTTNITETTYTYFEETEDHWPLLESKTTVPNGSGYFTTAIDYDYDSYGNVIKETLKAPGDVTLPDRIIDYEYRTDVGYDARFLTKKTINAPGDDHVTKYFYNLATATMKESIEINDLETNYQYDEFGNLKYTFHPDGNYTEKLRFWSQGTGHEPDGALFYTWSDRKISPLQQNWGLILRHYDPLGKELRTVTFGLNYGEPIYVDKTYDNYGRLDSVSEPYFSYESPELYTTFAYDELGRIATKTNPDGTIISTNYNGRETTVTNETTEIWNRKTVNAKGKIDWSKDPAGTINYNFDGAGRLIKTIALGISTQIHYDDAGNRDELIDPNAGTSTYTYNAFGQLTSQIDGRGNEYNMYYDEIGRLISKINTQYNPITAYYYINDISDFGFGQLERQVCVSHELENKGPVFYEYTYDHLGRLSTKTETIDSKSFPFTYQYNPDHGMLDYTTYPSGYVTRNFYNQRGYLYQVVNGSQVLWQANEMNARGQLEEYDLGNGLTTEKLFDDYGFPSAINTRGVQKLNYTFNPETGNLQYHVNDYSLYWRENYSYDDLLNTRLTGWQFSDGPLHQISYSNNGNIEQKTDVTSTKGAYEYGGGFSGPHAVTKVTKPVWNYFQKAEIQDISYTAFNKVEEITQGYNTPLVKRMKFNYGPDEARKKTQFFHVDLNGVEHLQQTKYFFGNYEVEVNATGNERKLHYLHGGDGVFAVFEDRGQGQERIYYVHKNYLGSYDVITNDVGGVEERLNFDPWGRRRDPNTGQVNDDISSMFDRGYTGHQHLDAFTLINMNGRVFDPVLARFLSPDPFVQSPGYGQNFNRYS
nr:hypothetical protein [Bacteroidota bacterium]